MQPRAALLIVVSAAAVLICPSFARAQAKDQFVQGLVDFITAVAGERGDEGRALVAAVDTMAAGLAQWNAAVGRVEAGLASEIGGAPPPIAAKMRATLGTAYLDRGRTADALRQFDQALVLDPSLGEVHPLRALALDILERPADAATAYRRAWQQDRTSVAHAYRFLSSDSSHANASEAADALNVVRTAAAQARQAGALFTTIAMLDDASVPAPMFPPARYSAAFAMLARARYDEAVTRLRALVATDPLVADRALSAADVSSAIAAVKTRTTDETIAGLANAVRAHAQSSEAHRVLGKAYAAASRFDKAREELEAAVRLDPTNERARLALADVFIELRDTASARVALAETTKALPASGEAHWKLGTIHQSFGDDANAVRSFEAAAKLSPFAGVGRLYGSLGRVQHNALELDAAVASYRRRLAVTPNEAAAHLDLADVYRAQDRHDEALAEALIASVLDPASARSFASIGQIHAAAGRDEEAVTALRRAITLEPSHLEAHYALSRALARLNRADEAREELQIFERLQAKAMEDQRRQFQENLQKIEQTLKATEPKDPAR